MKLSVGLFAFILTCSLLGGCASNEAMSAYAASEKPKVTQARTEQNGQTWSLQTPFGLLYGIIPREEVEYRTTRSPGTIVVSTKERRLYYVVGNGRAIRYPIAVGMEGYGW